MKPLDYRYLEAVELRRQGLPVTDELISCLINYLEKEEAGETTIENPRNRAIEIYLKGQQSRIIIESCLLARDSSEDYIATALRLNKETVVVYKYLFFDTSVLRDDLDLAEYMAWVRENRSDVEHITKSDAIRFGMYTILDNLHLGSYVRKHEEVADTCLSVADYMVRQVIGKDITSAEAKEAKSWIKNLFDLSKTKKEDGTKTDADFEKELQKIVLEPKKEVKDINLIKDKIVT